MTPPATPEAEMPRVQGEEQMNDPHAEGLDARIAGQPETANPYDPDEDFDAHCAWNDGWASEDDL